MFPKFPRLPTSPQELKNIILSEVINGLKFNTFFDNFDAERFNFDSVDRSKIFDTADRVFQLDWFFDNYEYLYAAFTLFEAERSRRLFLNLLAFRIAGHHSIRIETIFDENCASFEAYKAIETYTDSYLPTTGVFGKLRHYNFIYNSRRYVADCLGFKAYLYRKQYFFKDGATRISPEEGDFVIDAGACLGDTQSCWQISRRGG